MRTANHGIKVALNNSVAEFPIRLKCFISKEVYEYNNSICFHVFFIDVIQHIFFIVYHVSTQISTTFTLPKCMKTPIVNDGED